MNILLFISSECTIAAKALKYKYHVCLINSGGGGADNFLVRS